MALGTHHVHEPGADEASVTVPDPLEADRQAQSRELTERLARLRPDRVAVEAPYDWDDRLATLYDAYRSRWSDDPDPRPADPARDDPVVEPRNEIVVGFRLADRLDHDRVTPVDEHPDDCETDPFADRGIDDSRKTPRIHPTPAESGPAESDRLAGERVVESYRRINGEPFLRDTTAGT